MRTHIGKSYSYNTYHFIFNRIYFIIIRIIIAIITIGTAAAASKQYPIAEDSTTFIARKKTFPAPRNAVHLFFTYEAFLDLSHDKPTYR